jgi:hypothetical protein
VLILCRCASCAFCRYNADVFGRIYDVNGEAAIDDVRQTDSVHVFLFTSLAACVQGSYLQPGTARSLCKGCCTMQQPVAAGVWVAVLTCLLPGLCCPCRRLRTSG